jgi:hypothetical protein
MAVNEHVDGDDRIFWEGLRRSIADAEAGEREELAAAERELAEIEDAPEMSAAQIEAIVQRATATEVAAAKGKRSGPWVRVLLAAAAVMLAPKVFATVGVVTAAAVATFLLQDPTEWLRYQEAVHIALAEEHKLENRLAAQGTVFADSIYTIEDLKEMAAEDAEMAEPVARVLRSLRTQFASSAPFVERHLRGDMQAVIDATQDRSKPIATRLQELQRLGEFLVYGLSAMQQVTRDPTAPPKLKEQGEFFLQQILREVE